MKPYLESLILIAAIVLGSLTGLYTSYTSSLTDFFIIAMLFFLFYNVSLSGFFNGIKNRKYILVALTTNFILIPSIAFVLSTFVVDTTSAIFLGLIIYLIAPCTDWYLGFTKLANGNVEVNSALLPFNLLLQILLLPFYLSLFTSSNISIPIDAFSDVLIYWVLIPFGIAQLVRIVMRKLFSKSFEKSSSLAELLVLISLTLLIFSVFNVNIATLISNLALLPSVFAVILIFFVITFLLAWFIAKTAGFSKEERVSLTMTTAARNAPLMLGISLIFFPEAPLIQLVLVVGILVEFPHLITITYLLKKKALPFRIGK